MAASFNSRALPLRRGLRGAEILQGAERPTPRERDRSACSALSEFLWRRGGNTFERSPVFETLSLLKSALRSSSIFAKRSVVNFTKMLALTAYLVLRVYKV